MSLAYSHAFNGSAGMQGAIPPGSSTEYYPVPVIVDWKYEMRREAQQIIPRLYLGPFQASTSAERLREMGVTHILCVRDKKEAPLIYPRFPDQFVYLTLEISDSTLTPQDQNIITIFPRCKAFIDEALAAGGTVLAHCNGGLATSPAIVIGYLQWKFGWPYEQALVYVQSRRYCVSPTSLKEYEPITIAERMQAAARAASGGADSWDVTRANKREMDIDEDDEDEYRRRAPQRSGH